ncbi:TPA: hypothetical protein N0F65_004351 [Lagenidium giganteum]|uniref:Uncharacterized protein n=1 Tax=Lagenidium giganteum TaxID=4803 RepID=A0AAV2YHA8_9STRA|nr:TPA: hypothetical protein N0F65_004351 [Lagenidium giganteum]
MEPHDLGHEQQLPATHAALTAESRKRSVSRAWIPPVRPFTTMGATVLDLEGTQKLAPTHTQSPDKHTTASAHAPHALSSNTGPVPGEFDVKQFLLEQKAVAPLHKSSLFRNKIHEPEEFAAPRSAVAKKVLPRMELGGTPVKASRGGPIRQGSGHGSKQQPKKLAALPSTAPSPIGSDLNGSAGGIGPSANQVADDYDSVSHFYTLEKLAENCCHAVQTRHRTWQFLPGAEERSRSATSLTGVERPTRRLDLLDLERCFDTALQFAHRPNAWDVAASEKLAMIERDFLAIQTRVVQRFGSGSLDSKAGDVNSNGNTELTDDQRALAKLFFEQKWSDVMLGELEAMLTMSFLEQGVVLRKARIHYAQAFFQLDKLYGERVEELTRALGEIEAMRDEMIKANIAHEESAQNTKVFYEDELRRLTQSHEAHKVEMERKVVEAKEQMAKMSDTLKTLNTIFRQMREDTDKVKAVELRESYHKLEKKFDLVKDEVERLRPLIQLTQKLTEQKEAVQQENTALLERIQNFDELVAAKEVMIAQLMEQQSELLATQELRATQDDERRRGENNDHANDNDTNKRSTGASGPASKDGAPVICSRCKQSLKQQGEGSDDEEDNEDGDGGDANNAVAANADKESAAAAAAPDLKKKRVQCLFFRILLPNLRGRRPQREISWTLACMRSILYAKQVDDSMCRRSSGPFPRRIRMPEFVYAWFAPWKLLQEEKNQEEYGIGGSSAAIVDEDDEPMATKRDDVADTPEDAPLTPEQQQHQADEDRWCLYYGVKDLVQEGYLEAKLFLSLLDEKYGEDEQVFLLYCYRILDVLSGGRTSWGPLRGFLDYNSFTKEYTRLYKPLQQQSVADMMLMDEVPVDAPSHLPRVPKTVWISLYHATVATSIVLSKATESEREQLGKKLREFVVETLPPDEQPAYVLMPPKGVEIIKAARFYGDTAPSADLDEEESSGSQYVDAHLWVELMMLEYKEEQAHRRAAIRLMFQTATGSAATLNAAMRRVPSGTNQPHSTGTSAFTMDMEQFRVMARTLNNELPSFVVAMLFRDSYVLGKGSVTFDAFLEAAEASQFFSSCMRLESPTASLARLGLDHESSTQAALATSSKAASMVYKHFLVMEKELTHAIGRLPLWTRSVADTLFYEISSALMEGEGVDGVHVLTSFHRLIDALLLVKLTRREVTGGLFDSKHIFTFEKALTALLECLRLRDKTTVELLIDTVKQKMCITRVQQAFRLHLQRDEGAPLVMRHLLHREYGSGRTHYRSRRSVRPLSWLLHIISDVLRTSLRSDRSPSSTMLMELGGVSGTFTSTHAHLITCTMNGGIGPAPRPVLVEIVYDYFLDRFGTRWEAEKLLHDVFVNCRAFVKTNSRALLFSYLCSMSNASPDDRLLGQNEALAFLHAVLRCGLHSFRLINPPVFLSGRESSSSGDGDAAPERQDLISLDVAERILLAAFTRLGVDQRQRLRERLEDCAEAPAIITNLSVLRGATTGTRGSVSGPTSPIPNSDQQQQRASHIQWIDAEAFLVLALHEWKRYVLHRMNEIRVICCALEEEIVLFEQLLQIDTISSVLKKAGITYSNDDVCMIFRRLCSTDKVEPTAKTKASGKPPVQEHMSDRLAAACFPLLAKETLQELLVMENKAPETFKLALNILDSYRFLLACWSGYEEPCRRLLDDLRRVGKSNDIQADAVARRGGTPSSGRPQAVLYLSSSASNGALSSQDVAQLDAIHVLFLERLERLEVLFDKDPAERRRFAEASERGSTPDTTRDRQVVFERVLLVNETWKMFRQLLVGFLKLRAAGNLGTGPLPDRWDEAQAA